MRKLYYFRPSMDALGLKFVLLIGFIYESNDKKVKTLFIEVKQERRDTTVLSNPHAFYNIRSI